MIIERYRRRANRRIYPNIFWAYDWRARVRVKAFKLDSPRTTRFRWLRLSLLTNRFPDPIGGAQRTLYIYPPIYSLPIEFH